MTKMQQADPEDLRHANTKLDILFVITDLKIGGAERQVALLATELAKGDVTVAVYSLLDGDMRPYLEENVVRVMLAPSRPGMITRFGVKGIAFRVSAAFHLLWFMAAQRPRVAHFFLPAAYILGAPLAVAARIPVRVMSRRSLNDYQRNNFIRLIERRWHRMMHAVLGNSRRIVQELSAEGVNPSRLGLIYNGINVEMFDKCGSRDECRAGLDLPTDAVVLCVVANLIPYKGHSDLIDALALSARDLPSTWRLLIVGRDDGIGAELQAQTKRLNLQDNIVFLGPRTDVAAIMTASDIAVLCPRGNEGFSNAILEGMAAGLPLVVTDVGGNSEAVVDGETGLVVPARNVKGLAAAITRLANDPALRREFGAAGRRRVVKNYSVEQFVQGHQSLYAALIGGKAPVDVSEVRVSL